MVATLLSLWFYVAPVPGPAPGYVVAAWSHDSSIRLDDSRSAHVLIWPVDDESNTGPRRGRPEPILTEGESSDGNPADACPHGYPVLYGLHDFGRVLTDPNREYRVPLPGRSPVLRC
jgi:hypothetical protein